MTAALATLVVLFVLAALFGPPVLGVMQLILQGVIGLAVFVYRILGSIFVIGGYVVALFLRGIWLRIDRRGALEAYRAYPKFAELRD